MKPYPEDTVNDGTDAFSEAAYYDILALAYQVEDTSETMTPSEIIKTKETFERMVSMITGKAGIKNRQQWENDVRVTLALRTAIEKGVLQVDTVDDLEIIQTIILSGLRESPQVIEYYLKTGELVEAFLQLSKNNSLSAGRTRLRMLALYDYDLSSEEHKELPLEIRMNFAGCFGIATEMKQV